MVETSSSDRPLPQLSGRLESFASFEILQVVADLRKRGELRMQNEDGRNARCVVASGLVFEPSCGHLEGVEALVAMSWWNRGTFELFSIEPDLALGRPLRLPEVLMDAVRIADEIERRREHLPDRRERLALVPGAAVPEDGLGCELPVLFSYLERNPLTSLMELEGSLSLAPTKIRLGVALLHEMGLVAPGARLVDAAFDLAGTEGSLEFEEIEVNLQAILEDGPKPPTVATQAAGSPWWRRVLGQFPGGIRALVICPPDGLSDDAFQALSRLAESLGVQNPSSSYAADGPSFVRIRPSGGGILSFTFLPLARKHHYLFRAFVKSVEAVFLWSDGSDEVELGRWEERIPNSVLVIRLAGSRAIGEEIARHLRRMGDSCEPAPASRPPDAAP